MGPSSQRLAPQHDLTIKAEGWGYVLLVSCVATSGDTSLSDIHTRK